mmetsp:Transcript_12728/g.18579  ORF Transcript_12728/g.18579 Transcript_12728/m.18579 type:complete len:324 (-) Transcript_12728:78-1049(-)|eukprot:CAMPEP_0197242590 /NCGR_PEP_ID=MMETSP1429-20130617/8303_1 /TAXON_ID=49237 /ORGANISM="Chaetoceros  sp., Strain UNC1202" /LENGTH=323 /DNA_ID=CAMNT_0042702651 /DNA_START=187 /DNA_END=1158 /DNA_ORIENTATION=+
MKPTSSTGRSSAVKGAAKAAKTQERIRHYIFGYGSLICSKSRKITAPTLKAEAHPVVVNYLRRTWTARLPHRRGARPKLDHLIHGHTAMGIERSWGHNCTGVLIEVDAEELKRFDRRERGYDRTEIDLRHIFSIHDDDDNDDDDAHGGKLQHDHHVLRKAYQWRRSSSDETTRDDGNGNGTDDDKDKGKDSDAKVVFKVWVYIPRAGQGEAADDHYPIMQSYLDIILRGCISIGEDFTVKFLQSTHGWWHDLDGPIDEENSDDDRSEGEAPKYVWVDDRHAPYYIRADPEWSSDMRHILDDYLRKVHPQPLEKRKHLDTLESL